MTPRDPNWLPPGLPKLRSHADTISAATDITDAAWRSAYHAMEQRALAAEDAYRSAMAASALLSADYERRLEAMARAAATKWTPWPDWLREHEPALAAKLEGAVGTLPADSGRHVAQTAGPAAPDTHEKRTNAEDH